METYKPILETAIYSIPIFVVLGIYFLTTIFACDKKKRFVRIPLTITFMLFPLLIMFCFFNSMGYAFSHSPHDTEPHIIAVYAILIYMTAIWFPTFIIYTYMNMKAREMKEMEAGKEEIKNLDNIEPQKELKTSSPKKETNIRNSFFRINLPNIIFIVILLFFLKSSIHSGHIVIHPLAFIYTLINITTIIVILTIPIIYKSTSQNIKTILILASLNLFCLSLYPQSFLFLALIISFVFYLISAILSNKIEEIAALLGVSALMAITTARSFFTVTTFIFLLAIIILTAYIKYSKVKRPPCEELENKIV